VCEVYPAQIGAQLKRYGTNVAKWGFNVCVLHHFNGLGGAKNGKKSTLDNFRVMSLTTSLGRQHRTAFFYRTSKLSGAEPKRF
jgi:hypothetical protein